MNMRYVIEKADIQMLKMALPCPFCGEADLMTSAKWLHEYGKEVTAIECKTCGAEAPFNSWQHRRDENR